MKKILAAVIGVMVIAAQINAQDHQPHGLTHTGIDPIPTVSVPGQKNGLMPWQDADYLHGIMTPVPTATPTATSTSTNTPTPSVTPSPTTTPTETSTPTNTVTPEPCATGYPGYDGAAGAVGGAMRYAWDSAVEYPNTGYVSLDNADPSAATRIRVDDQNMDGVNVENWIQLHAGRGAVVTISEYGEVTQWLAYRVTGAVTDRTGYWEWTIAEYLGGNGALQNNGACYVALAIDGEQGEQGAPGPTWTPQPTATITPTPTVTPTPSPTPTLFVHETSVQVDGDHTVNGSLSVEEQATFQSMIANGNGGANKTIDWTAGNYQSVILDSTPTALTFTPPSGICSVHLFLIQDAGGGKTVSWPSVKWLEGAPPTLTTAGSAVDIATFVWSGSLWYGMYGHDFK